MAKHWTTEVLTTCALDYMTWEKFYPPGTEQVGTTLVRRFPVDQPRNVAAFNRLSEELHGRQQGTTLTEQEEWMRAQGPISSALLTYLDTHQNSYDAFVFFGYLYATSYFGLPLVQKKAYLAPLAHDEWTIYFSMWDEFFSRPKAFLFNSQTERKFLEQRFPSCTMKGQVVALGIQAPANIDPDAFRARYQLIEPFLLYVGRVDESKGCGKMFEYFIRWKKEENTSHKLVLMGTEVMPIPFHDDIIHLGFLGEIEKWEAMSACDWLLMPSVHESLSMVLLETWSVGRPALVNGACDVLTNHCKASHGGLWSNDFKEWSTALSVVDDEMKSGLGRQGQRYVAENYSWDRVEQDYRTLLHSPSASLSRAK